MPHCPPNQRQSIAQSTPRTGQQRLFRRCLFEAGTTHEPFEKDDEREPGDATTEEATLDLALRARALNATMEDVESKFHRLNNFITVIAAKVDRLDAQTK